MIEANTDSVLKFLKEKKYDAQVQQETGQVYFIFKEDDREYPLFIRFFEGGELLQLIAFFPMQLKQEVIPDVSRLLHLLNKELDIPGFGLDEFGGAAFFRCMQHIVDQKLDEKLLEQYVTTIQTACKTFGKTIEAVLVGATTVDDLIKKAQEAAQGT